MRFGYWRWHLESRIRAMKAARGKCRCHPCLVGTLPTQNTQQKKLVHCPFRTPQAGDVHVHSLA